MCFETGTLLKNQKESTKEKEEIATKQSSLTSIDTLIACVYNGQKVHIQHL